MRYRIIQGADGKLFSVQYLRGNRWKTYTVNGFPIWFQAYENAYTWIVHEKLNGNYARALLCVVQ